MFNEVKERGSGRVINRFIGVEFKEKTDTTYTVANADHGDVLDMNNASSITVNLPTGVEPGFHCCLRKLGAGNVVLAEGAGATLQAPNSYTTLSTQYKMCTIVKKDATTWVAEGLES